MEIKDGEWVYPTLKLAGRELYKDRYIKAEGSKQALAGLDASCPSSLSYNRSKFIERFWKAHQAGLNEVQYPGIAGWYKWVRSNPEFANASDQQLINLLQRTIIPSDIQHTSQSDQKADKLISPNGSRPERTRSFEWRKLDDSRTFTDEDLALIGIPDFGETSDYHPANGQSQIVNEAIFVEGLGRNSFNLDEALLLAHAIDAKSRIVFNSCDPDEIPALKSKLSNITTFLEDLKFGSPEMNPEVVIPTLRYKLKTFINNPDEVFSDNGDNKAVITLLRILEDYLDTVEKIDKLVPLTNIIKII